MFIGSVCLHLFTCFNYASKACFPLQPKSRLGITGIGMTLDVAQHKGTVYNDSILLMEGLIPLGSVGKGNDQIRKITALSVPTSYDVQTYQSISFDVHMSYNMGTDNAVILCLDKPFLYKAL